MRFRFPIALALGAFLVASCQDAPVEPAEMATVAAPSFGIGNAPDQTGVVYRGAGGWWEVFNDPATGWAVTFGINLPEACTGDAVFAELQWADKDLPVEFFRDNSLNIAESAYTVVWPFTVAFQVEDCELYTTVEPVATGYSDLVWTDNDLFGSDNPNSNTWGWMAHGTLAWADGTPAHFSFHRRLVWHKDAPAKLVSQKLNLN
jgi:hypothetical protein